MRRCLTVLLAASTCAILAASPAAAQSCEECSYLSCDSPCWVCAGAEHPDGSCGRIAWTTCSGDTNDSDGDGVGNGTDNCICTSNSSQANCDGDAQGDACDSVSSNYVLQSEQLCMIDHDEHGVYFELERHIDRLYVDASSCNAPSYYDTYEHPDSTWCFNVSARECCEESMGESDYWCSRIGQDFCQGN